MSTAERVSWSGPSGVFDEFVAIYESLFTLV